MEIGPLLVEQRRIGDEFRVAEKAILEVQKLLARRDTDPASRARMEAGVASSFAELMRLGQRMLELDASVRVAAAPTLSYSTASSAPKFVISDLEVELPGQYRPSEEPPGDLEMETLARRKV